VVISEGQSVSTVHFSNYRVALSSRVGNSLSR
jgi:hypothetical protein